VGSMGIDLIGSPK